jgi:hypothetical protein
VPECINDVPYIQITTGNQPQLNGMTATLQFIDVNGNLVETQTAVYQSNTTYHFLYPGAAVDPVTGEATDWPGWVQLPDGRWTEDPTDSFLRDGLHVIIDVNPHAEADVSYPPATSACASPPPGERVPPTTTTTTVPGELPPTL